ncbi:MAG: polyprenyl synthetase family protein [Pseudomonadota bacterium]
MKHSNSDAFAARLASTAQLVMAGLGKVLGEVAVAGEASTPKQLIGAMRHSALNGGKRLRPFLLLECGRIFGVDADDILDVAVALECIHCYSLVHDDLPSMDDDDLRRGQPTVHVAFDEATAILAGDALLTLAFDLITRPERLDSQQKLALVQKLARAAGRGGMVGGQMLDLAFEKSDEANADLITQIHAMKTGALLRFACQAGAICGKASPDEYDALVIFGETIGVIFQLADDLLDVTASTGELGKTAGKDIQAGKITHIALYGENWARERLRELVAEAENSLEVFGEKAGTLRAAAHFAAYRDH